MRISVTQRHIDYGESRNDEGCPVYLAIDQALGVDKHSIQVEGTGASIDGRFIPFPSEVTTFICDFDRHEPVFSFEFEFCYDGSLAGG